MSEVVKVRKLLKMYLGLDAQISNLNEQIERTRSQMHKITSHISNTPNGKGKTDWAASIDMLQELEKQLRSKIEEKCRMRSVITGLLDQVENLQYRAILESRYIVGKSWQKIAIERHYSVDRIWHIESAEVRKIKLTPEAKQILGEPTD